MKFRAIEIFNNCNNIMDYKAILEAAHGTCSKIPITHKCYILKHKTTFKTETGEQIGEPGMVAIIGDDHAWPVTMEYFKKHYQYTAEIPIPKELMGE